MEMFREGGFDYPYQLKLAEQVSQAVSSTKYHTVAKLRGTGVLVVQ